jgi:large subunit ribosomal protein L15
VKLLGDGDAPQGLVVKGLKVSASARAKIEAAGGRVEE